MPDSSRSNLLIILILGALSTVSPFSIDMYLPAFPQIARDLGTTPAQISLSVSGYFIGLALGQLFYGPLLDRFGRKPPLYAGLSLFAVASFGCIAVRSPEWFIAFRLLQALGGCVAQVGAIAMVRDFFPARESAKILSLLLSVERVAAFCSLDRRPDRNHHRLAVDICFSRGLRIVAHDGDRVSVA